MLIFFIYLFYCNIRIHSISPLFMPIDHCCQSSFTPFDYASHFLTLRQRYKIETGRYEYLNATQSENIRYE